MTIDQILESAPKSAFVFVLSAAGVYQSMREPPDPARCRSAEWYIGRTLEQALPPELARPRRFFFDLAVELKAVQTYGYPHPTTKGRWMACTLSPVIAEGEVAAVVMEVYDIAPFAKIASIYVNR